MVNWWATLVKLFGEPSRLRRHLWINQPTICKELSGHHYRKEAPGWDGPP